MGIADRCALAKASIRNYLNAKSLIRDVGGTGD
jgi:hypothetical protein